MLLLKNGLVVTGDGRTLYEKASVLIDDEGDIAYVGERVDDTVEAKAEVVDCTGKAVMPGMINHHQHGVTFGPIFASGLKNYGRERIIELLDRDLLQGHTTTMNVDGFATMDEVKETQANHPMRLKTATTHLPSPANSRSSSITANCPPGSSQVVGSSSSSTRASCASTMASRARWRWPPERVRTSRSASSAAPARRSARSTASRSAAEGPYPKV